MEGRRNVGLSPAKRRAAIIEAALPLLQSHGRTVTSAQLAHAAGISEGTLFRVFEDKNAVIAETVRAALDPGPSLRKLKAIDRAQPLRVQLVQAVAILQRRYDGIWHLLGMLALSSPPPTKPNGEPDGEPLRIAVEAMLEAHRDELTCEPRQAMRLLRMLTFAGTHPRLTDNDPLTPEQIVATLLDGIGRGPR